MKQTYSRCDPAEDCTASKALKYDTQTSGSAAFLMALSSHSEPLFTISLCNFFKQSKYVLSPHLVHSNLLVQQLVWTLTASFPWSICTALCKAPVTWANNMFWLSRVRVSSGRCCYVAGEKQASRCHVGQRAAGMESQSPAVRSVYGGGLCLRMSPCGLFTPSWTSITLI